MAFYFSSSKRTAKHELKFISNRNCNNRISVCLLVRYRGQINVSVLLFIIVPYANIIFVLVIQIIVMKENANFAIELPH